MESNNHSNSYNLFNSNNILLLKFEFIKNNGRILDKNAHRQLSFFAVLVFTILTICGLKNLK